ncbi:MAG: MBL fold metallo-hydrolase [Candidatus Riflebacteria bacterium]|nr:MBL fold metallo-hydrolase [Candidatus Riflebacteria bacterium]
MQIKALTDKVHVVSGGVNVGIVKIDDNKVVLIDSGFDSRFGMRLLEMLDNYGYRVECILNTHAHADHMGGNAVIRKSTGCYVLAGKCEVPAIENPIMQAIALFGGSPIPELLNPMMFAEPCKAEPLETECLKFGNTEIKVIDLPGHSIDQKGFLVDGVAFLADSVFSAAAILKHRLIYLYDPLLHIKTCQELKTLKADWYVGGHIAPVTNIAVLIAENLGHTQAAMNYLKGILQVPQSLDRLIKTFFSHFMIKQNGWQHFLYRATLNGYLSALKRSDSADFKIMDNLLIWYAI